MKFLHQLLSIPALAALLVAALPARAATGPGKPQALTSPDQVPEGLAKSDWSSIRAAYEAGRHAFQPTATGWQARNPGQQWTTQFDKRGFLATPKDGGWQWGLELQSYGFAENPTAISGTPAVRADGQRLSYQWDANVQEWFVNDARGLEHGFTVNRRPASAAASTTLDFLLGVRGGLRPQVTGDTLGVEFRDAAGATVLNYSGLKVWDADGKVLASRFAAAGENQVRLLVDERGARYPLTIDPIAQQAYLKASNTPSGPGGSDNFGRSVAVSGDTVVVGANNEDSSTTGVNSTPNELAANAGAAYVFVRSGGAWTQQAYLKASQVTGNDKFGGSVAVSGDTVVVGATLEDSSTTGVNSTANELAADAGAAYLFTVIANTAPLATAQSVTTAEDTAVAITLAGTDADGNPLTYAVAAGPAHGSLSGSAPNLSYTPAANYYGSDSFTFNVNDGTVVSATATVSITVTPAALTPIETWRNQYFGSPANTGNGADTASAGDGIANLLKYALVIVPGENAASGLPKSKIAVNGGDRYLALTFKRDPARNDVTIIVQASDNLSGWTEVARCTNGGSFTGSATVTETENPDGTRNVEVRDVQAVAGVPRRFMRVSVNHPE